VPDLAGWHVAPHWIAEVLSPGTARLDRGRKADLYASFGVEHLWLVDPEARHVEAFERRGAAWLRLGLFAQVDARIPPFDAVELDLPSLFVFPSER
jgi:Uma2 family endonuclease